MKKRQLVIIASAIGILVAGFAINRLLASLKEAPARKPTEKEYKLVRTRRITNDTLTQRTPLRGKLIAQEKIEVFSEVTGVLLRSDKPFKVGQTYRANEVMLHMDGSESALNLKSQRSAFVALLAQSLPDLKLDYTPSYDDWSRFHSSIETSKDLPPLPRLEDSQLESFLAARNILQQYYAIQSLERRQEKFTITAPFDGVVTMGSLNGGTLIRAGQKLGEFLMTGAYELEAALPISDAINVKVGDRAVLRLADGASSYTGKVTRVAGNVAPNDQRISVFVQVKGPSLKEGMYLEGIIEVNELENAVEIPRNLISPDTTVFLVSDSVLVKRSVILQDLFNESAFVTGLNTGDVLLDQVVDGAYEGMLIKIQPNN